MPRPSRGGFPVRTQRRRSSWEDGPGAGRSSISSTTPQFIGAAAAVISDGITLARIRGELYFMLATADAAGSRIFGAVGIGVSATEAVAAGIGSVPTPVTEQDAETWLWWSSFFLESVTDTETVQGSVNSFRIPIDTKAMRKLNVGDTIYAAVEASGVSGTVAATFFLDMRMLVLLP